MTETIIARAESIIREAMIHMPRPLKRRAELFLARQPGRPRKATRAICAALRAQGLTAEQIATKLDCHPCNVWRALREIE
jgi:DNA-binding CsgD family transcriptional regulator